MHKKFQYTPNRRGAALLVAIVLLTLLAIVAGAMLPQMIRNRQENRLDLLRTQSRQLLDDALHHAEAKRHAEPEFSGETFTLGPDKQPFPGTFQVTTRYEEDSFAAKVEYRTEKGKLLYTINRPLPAQHSQP